MNGDRLIADAKQEVLNLAASGYVQPVERTDILALGEQGQAAFKIALHMMLKGGFISEHDATDRQKDRPRNVRRRSESSLLMFPNSI